MNQEAEQAKERSDRLIEHYRFVRHQRALLATEAGNNRYLPETSLFYTSAYLNKILDEFPGLFLGFHAEVFRHLLEGLRAVQVLSYLDSVLQRIRLEIRASGQSSSQFDESIGFADLHATITTNCEDAFRTGQMDNAILNAFKTIETAVRSRISGTNEDIGMALVSKAMSGDAPKLRFSTVKAEQDGMHSLFRGAIASFKNPQSHRFVNTKDSIRVLELLAFASLLMELLEEAEAT